MKNLWQKIAAWFNSIFHKPAPTPTPVPDPVPNPSGNPVAIPDLIRGVRIADGAWETMTAATLAQYKTAGVNLIEVELMSYVITGDPQTVFNAQVQKYIAFARKCWQAGLPSGFSLNTNDAIPGTAPQRISIIDGVFSALGDTVTCQPASETDHAGDGWASACRTHAAAKFSHCEQYAGTISGWKTEVHPQGKGQGYGGYPANASTYRVMDSGPLFNASAATWKAELTAAPLASFAIYGDGAHTTPAIAAQVFGGAVAPTMGATVQIKNATTSGFDYFVSGVDAWPTALHEVMQCSFQIQFQYYDASGRATTSATCQGDWLPPYYANAWKHFGIDQYGQAAAGYNTLVAKGGKVDFFVRGNSSELISARATAIVQ